MTLEREPRILGASGERPSSGEVGVDEDLADDQEPAPARGFDGVVEKRLAHVNDVDCSSGPDTRGHGKGVVASTRSDLEDPLTRRGVEDAEQAFPCDQWAWDLENCAAEVRERRRPERSEGSEPEPGGAAGQQRSM